MRTNAVSSVPKIEPAADRAEYRPETDPTLSSREAEIRTAKGVTMPSARDGGRKRTSDAASADQRTSQPRPFTKRSSGAPHTTAGRISTAPQATMSDTAVACGWESASRPPSQ